MISFIVDGLTSASYLDFTNNIIFEKNIQIECAVRVFEELVLDPYDFEILS